MDDVDRRILDAIQVEVPLEQRPFQALGAKLGLGEAELMKRIGALREARIIRQISAIFDTRSLGYDSCLAAMQIRPDHLDEAADLVSEHPGVSHNYAREHPFNLWFTLAVPPGESLQAHLDCLNKLTRAISTRPFPTLRLFKIGLHLDMGSGDKGDPAPLSAPASPAAESSVPSPDAEAPPPAVASPEPPPIAPITNDERRVILEIQKDLPLEAAPFDAMAAATRMPVHTFLGHLKQFGERGVMRRYAAVLHHRRAGFSANGMGVWVVPEERIEEVGRAFAERSEVSHCYRRPVYEDWPYNLFTMVHAQSEEDCERILREMSESAGIADYRILYSTKEYKKVRLKYFTGETEAWAKKRGIG